MKDVSYEKILLDEQIFMKWSVYEDHLIQEQLHGENFYEIIIQ